MYTQPHRPPSPALGGARQVLCVLVAALVLARGALAADSRLVDRPDSAGPVKLTAGRSLVLTTTRPYKRASTAQPEVADINAVAATSVLVTAKKPGSTQIILWDDAERCQTIDVIVQADLGALREQLEAALPGVKIEAASVNGAIVLRGRVPNLKAAEQAVQLAEPFSPKVLNLLEIAGGQQVMLQVRFAEVSRSASSALGVNFGFTDGRSFAGSNIGQVSPLGIVERESGGGVDLAVQSPTTAVTLFGSAAVGDSALAYFISALRQNNLLRILAEPNLVTASGEEASFLAGGEFPVPVSQSGAGTGTPAITVEYRDFGVKLVFVPTVLGDGRIRMKVAPEVSDLDFTTAVRFSGFVVPGLSTRKVATTVELGEGQTFAIAGLLNSNITASKDVTPLLGDLPVLGALFRSVRYQRKETELVILVTPRLVEAMDPGQVPPAPGQNWKNPTENDLFLNAALGGPVARDARPTPSPAQPPRFYGQYGFHPVTQDAQ